MTVKNALHLANSAHRLHFLQSITLQLFLGLCGGLAQFLLLQQFDDLCEFGPAAAGTAGASAGSVASVLNALLAAG